MISQPVLFKQLMSMNSNGYLNEIGWINSFKTQMPIDHDEKPLPWVTYGFIDRTMDIFEYGSGNSTLWHASKVNSVTSIEHDKKWSERIKNTMPKNSTIYYQALEYDGKYSKFSHQLNKKFDIIIVDGRDRVNCVKNSINGLKENGVIVLDDSERRQYTDAIDFLLDENFKKIDFWGISPGLFYKKIQRYFTVTIIA